MTKTILDRISMGDFISPEDGKILDKRGRICFNLHVNRGGGPQIKGIYTDHYFIIGKLSKGGIAFDQDIPQRELIDKQTFLKAVNDDLAQVDCYLAEAEYSNGLPKGFPVFGLHSVQGILYKENEINPHAKGEK
jgi:hypothetical protein